MTAFTDVWDGSFEATPPGTQAANLLDTRIQELKVAIRERTEVEHYWAGDTEDGVHKFPLKTIATRDAIGTPKSGQVVVHSDTRGISIHNGSDWIEYFTNSPGDLKMAAYDASADPGWLKCDGTAVSRTTYATLFTAISTKYGVGDGSTTFNLPDLQGNVPVGKDGGADFTDVGDAAGAFTVALVEAELAAHTHGLTTSSDGAHDHDVSPGTFTPDDQSGPAVDRGSTPTSLGAHTHTGPTDSTGSGDAHNNIQPSLTFVWYIKT